MNRVYICGPMSGFPGLNEAAFREAAGILRDTMTCDPVVPHDVGVWEHEGSCKSVYGGQPAAQGDHDGGCYLRADIAEMVRCDWVYRLPGWSRSRGAQLESLIAGLLRIPIVNAPGAEVAGSAIADLGLVADETAAFIITGDGS